MNWNHCNNAAHSNDHPTEMPFSNLRWYAWVDAPTNEASNNTSVPAGSPGEREEQPTVVCCGQLWVPPHWYKNATWKPNTPEIPQKTMETGDGNRPRWKPTETEENRTDGNPTNGNRTDGNRTEDSDSNAKPNRRIPGPLK